MDNSFRDGEVKTTGTDIEKILPPMRRFGGGNRAEKKQTIIDKLKKFFEKYFGISDSKEDNENITYSTNNETETLKVAEDGEWYKTEE